MICKELVRLVVDNDCLEEKLNHLQNEKKKVKKYSKRFLSTPFTAKRFKNKIPKYKVNSKIDYNFISERQIEKVEINEQKKAENELNECTFRPQININSLRMIKKKFSNKKKGKKKTLRKGNIFTKKKLEVSSFRVKNLTVKNKLNKDFYHNQLEWVRMKKEKLKTERFEKNKKQEENFFKKNFKKKKIGDKKNFEPQIKNFTDIQYLNKNKHPNTKKVFSKKKSKYKK